MLANTPKPPYYAVIFTSLRSNVDKGYSKMAIYMQKLASNQSGFLGVESARDEIGITVSYWKDMESIKKWSANIEHLEAKIKGKSYWYKEYKVRISKVENEYEFYNYNKLI